MQRARPAAVLIEKIAFRVTATCNEDAVQTLVRARNFVTAFSVAVDLEPHDRLELRQHVSIEV
jgi:hypothetical protein